MKKCFFLLFVLISSLAMAQDAVAKFKWDAAPEFDFGKVAQGTPVSHEFNFTNTGKETLIITDVKTSCGCTAPTWPKDPMPPGVSNVIKVTFNGAMVGVFNKSITVTANVEGGTAVLTVKGEVVDKAEAKGSTVLSKAGSDVGGTAVKKETPAIVKKADSREKKAEKKK